MSVILLPDKWRRQPSGPVAINEALWPGRAQAFLPSLGYNGVISAGAGSGRIVTLQNANAPFTLRKNGKVVHAYRPNSSTAPGESFKWQTPDFDVGPNASMVFYGYTLLDNYGVALEYGGSNWGLLLNIDTGSDVRGSYVDSPTTAQFDATISGAAPAVGVPITVGLIKSGNAVTVVTSSQQATTTGGNGGIRRSAGSGFGSEYTIGSSYVGLMLGAVSSVPLSIGQMREILNAPYAILRKKPRILYFNTAGGGGATGTLAATESGSDTAALTGDVLIDGALAATESGSDTAALTGDVIVQGALAVTESGTDTAAATGLVLVQGALAATESGSDTAALAGLVLVQGSIASVEPGADTASIAGDVLVSGALAASETGSDTAAFTGDASLGIFGSIDAAESGSDSAQVTGLVLIQGGLAVTETGSDTAAITGPAAVSGSIAATETGSDTAAVTGLVLIYGSLATTETGSDTAAVSSFRPTVPGIEYTLPEGKAHYTLPDGRAHYTIAA